MSKLIPNVIRMLQNQYPNPQEQESVTINLIKFQMFRPILNKKIQQFERLNSLSLTYCDMRNLLNFPNVPLLKNLDLGHNSLQGSMNNLMKCRKLQYLDISHNLIPEVKQLFPLKKIGNLCIFLKGNPFAEKDGWATKAKSYTLKVLKQPKKRQSEEEKKPKSKKESKDCKIEEKKDKYPNPRQSPEQSKEALKHRRETLKHRLISQSGSDMPISALNLARKDFCKMNEKDNNFIGKEKITNGKETNSNARNINFSKRETNSNALERPLTSNQSKNEGEQLENGRDTNIRSDETQYNEFSLKSFVELSNHDMRNFQSVLDRLPRFLRKELHPQNQNPLSQPLQFSDSDSLHYGEGRGKELEIWDIEQICNVRPLEQEVPSYGQNINEDDDEDDGDDDDEDDGGDQACDAFCDDEENSGYQGNGADS